MKKNYYINNAEFEQLIVNYLDNREVYEEELIDKFDLLITNIIDSFGFSVDRDDAKQECFLLVLKTLNNFSPSKGSAFNYFTTVIVNNLKLLYTKDKRYRTKISNYIEYKTGQTSGPKFEEHHKYGEDSHENQPPVNPKQPSGESS